MKSKQQRRQEVEAAYAERLRQARVLMDALEAELTKMEEATAAHANWGDVGSATGLVGELVQAGHYAGIVEDDEVDAFYNEPNPQHVALLRK